MGRFSFAIDEDDDAFGPGTDLVISLVAVLLVFLSIGFYFYFEKQVLSYFYKVKYEDYKQKYESFVESDMDIEALLNKIAQLENEIELLKNYVARLKAVNKKLEADNASFRRDKLPPVITLYEASGYSFQTGKAELSKSFKKLLRNNILPKLEHNLEEYDVNVIEIIGHTDSQRVEGKHKSNLDKFLKDAFTGIKPINKLEYASNTELGIIRALSVMKYLKEISRGEMKNVEYRVYSAAQLIPAKGNLNKNKQNSNDPSSRRIELRFTKLGKEE